MSRAYVPYIAALAALWGASYMFIKVADRAFEPATMILFRLLISSTLLLAVLVSQRGFAPAIAGMRGLGWQGFGLGVVNGAIPFTLIAWGEKHIDSGVAAIANATVPIFVLLLALRFQPSERVSGLRLGGFLLGLIGVGVLAGIHPRGGWWGAAGTLAVVVASLAYAIIQGPSGGWFSPEILGFFTLGVWWLVWLALVIFGGEKRTSVGVDEWGNTNVQRL